MKTIFLLLILASQGSAVTIKTSNVDLSTPTLGGAILNSIPLSAVVYSTTPAGTLFGNASILSVVNSNVGIGTTNPLNALHVGGVPVTALSTAGQMRLIDTTAAVTVSLGIESNATDAASIRVHNTSTGGKSWAIRSEGSATGNGTVGDLLFRNQTDTLNVMSLKAAGNVGIGTTNPGALLSLGTSLANSKLYLYDDGSFFYGMGVQSGQYRMHVDQASSRFSFLSAPAGTEVLTVMGAGNVGINDTTPDGLLDVLSNAAPTGYAVQVSSQSNSDILFGVMGNGVIVSSSAIPTIACDAGTGALATYANNNWGAFTAGAAATNCTVTFSGDGWPNNASCVISERTSLVAARVSAQSKTAFTVAGTTISGDVIAYHCDGN